MPYFLDVILFLIVVFGFSYAALRVGLPRYSALETVVLGLGGALGTIGLLVWLFGSTIALNSVTLTAAVVIGLGVNLLLLHRSRAATRGVAQGLRQTVAGLSLGDRLLCLYLALVFAMTLMFTLAPPNSGDYDSLMYHLAVPQQYLRMGHIGELSYDHHSYFPFTVEMLYAVGLGLRNAVFAKLFHWVMLPLCCMALVAIGQRHLSLRAGLLGAAVWASLPVAQAEASTAYIDLGLAAFSLCAALCVLRWLRDGRAIDLVLAGIFCGFCLGTKYLGVLTFGWLGIWALVTMIRSKETIAWKPLTGFAVAALLIGGGWYVRNAVWTGNPVFPFAYGLFGGRGWTAEMAAAYSRDQAAFGFGRSPGDLLLLPWRLSMTPLDYLAARGIVWPFSPGAADASHTGLFDTPGMLWTAILGPALLAFCLPLVFMKRKPASVGFVLWSFVFFAVFWAATGQYLRYLVPAFALLCLAAGWGLSEYLKRGAILRWVAGLSLVGWLLVTPLFTFANARGNLPVILGAVTPDEFLMRTFSGYDAMRWAGENTPPEAKFAVWGEPRCFYLNRSYFWADAGHNRLIDFANTPDGTALVKRLKELGATHVLTNTQAARNGGFGDVPPQVQSAIDAGLLSQLYEARGYYVYSIR